ncbi:hypothetical protein [Allorhizobium ampelinum]|uniref:hypothetical protein n=1 Tax=Allorhizobium ampelinum TaxID=3025782 RepID=UPI000B3FFF3A|nr:hypothetical protein [Allorhizobium ampelinum]NTA27420.1 hypothetical protein [Allorhizobium ampelinum]OVE94477.1 hypothetical protein B7W85_13070 [Allorhizobium ampelinum]
MIQAATYKSADEIFAAAKARRERLGLSRIKVVNIARIRAVEAPEAKDMAFDDKPSWMMQESRFDSHVILFRQAQKLKLSPAKAYILKRATELGLPYEEVTGPSRAPKVIAVRDKIVFEMKHIEFPNISYPQMGRLFHKDHTSMLAAYRRGGLASGHEEFADLVYHKRATCRERNASQRKMG